MGRLQLQALLESIEGVADVYFQPPSSYKMVYPCIVYNLSRTRKVFADNKSYKSNAEYEVTVIDPDPDSLIPDAVNDLPYCSHDRFFVNDNLNHNVYTLFF